MQLQLQLMLEALGIAAAFWTYSVSTVVFLDCYYDLLQLVVT